MANLEIMCAAEGPAKCSFGPWRGTREEGWCDMFNIKQPYLLPPGKVCKYADAMPQVEIDFGGVFDGFSVQSDADPGL